MCVKILLTCVSLFLFCMPTVSIRAQAETDPRLILENPQSGSAVQGSTLIQLSGDLPENVGAELTFGYANDPGETWFLLWETDLPISVGELTTWDTTKITDGEYNLRLVIRLVDGDLQETLAEDIRVRNYTPIETNTPLPTLTALTQTFPTLSATAPFIPITPTITPQATPSANPAELTPAKLLQATTWAVGAVAGIFLLIGFYAWARGIFRNRP
jgi:hypothetical protein